MAVQVAIPGMRRINHRVDQCVYAADVGVDGITTVDIPAPPAANATGIINAQSIAAPNVSAVPATTFVPATMMGRYGRNLTVVASGAATSNVTVQGWDYLGQAVRESFTLNGATPVVGKKMFYDIAGVTFGNTAGTTINVGFGPILGVPYKVLGTQILHELTSNLTPTAGALVPGTDTQTLTSNDPRGTYTPNQVPDGVKSYRFTCVVDRNNLHGNAHVIA
jgi:hypothetical protein